MKLSDRSIGRQAIVRGLLLSGVLAVAVSTLPGQDPGPSVPSAEEVGAVADVQAEIERLTIELRHAMSDRQWTAAVNAADALLLLDPTNSTARVLRVQAMESIEAGVPEGVPMPTPGVPAEQTPVQIEVPQPAGTSDGVPPRTIRSGGDTPVELILAAIGAVLLLLVVIWFFFFARKKPAERRTPATPVEPVVPRPISPYGKAKAAEPVKDENLIQYGSVGQLNQPGGDVVATTAAAAGAAAVSPAPSPAPQEVKPVEPPTEPDPARPSSLAAPDEPPKLPSVQDEDTLRDESTHEEAGPSNDAVAVTEPAPQDENEEAPRPVLSDPVEHELEILKVDLESVEISPAAPPESGSAGPDESSLPSIKLSDDLPIAAAPTPVPEEEEVLGADLPIISFDESVPLDLGEDTPAGDVPSQSHDASLPSLKFSEDAVHFGGADEVELNDLPDLEGDLGDEQDAMPSISLSDTALEDVVSKGEKAIKDEAASGGDGEGVRTIKLEGG